MRVFIQVTKEEKGENILVPKPRNRHHLRPGGGKSKNASDIGVVHIARGHQLFQCWFILFLFNGMIALQSVVFC